MKVKDIYSDNTTKVFFVTNQDSQNELDWIIEPTVFEIVPEVEGAFFVKAKLVYSSSVADCYMSIITPERISETVIKVGPDMVVVAESINEQDGSVISTVASEYYGNYELFYARENPQIGIDILKNGLSKVVNKGVVAADLGYILRDEGRSEEAIEAFKICESAGPTSEYVFLELSMLYQSLGNTEKEEEYEQLFKNKGNTK
jgi:tetratricopeptide (TPR) repeat protein